MAVVETTFAAQDRALVILIENGGIDLGIPALVDKLWPSIPGSSLLPDSIRTKLVDFVGEKIRSFTDNLLETVELTANRYTAAKPEFFGDVTILRDSTASYQDLKNKLLGLSRDGRVVDLLILTHGSDDYISVTGGINGQKIRDMKTENGKPLPLRSVYMMNCVGSSLNQAWIDAGAKVSSGALHNNYLPEPTTFFFWSAWKDGQTFENAVTSAYRKTINLMKDALNGFLSSVPGGSVLAGSIDIENLDFVKDSAPVIQGQRSVTINTDDLAFTQSLVASSLSTTVLSSRYLNALRFSRTASDDQTRRTLSSQAVDFIKQWEGFVGKMYNDPVGHCTIGYGTLLHRGNCDGRESEQPYAGGITEAKATELLAQEAGQFQQVVNDSVSVPLTQNQNDALVSFVYNIGSGAFRNSTLLRLLNQSKYDAVPGELKKWTKARQNGSLVDLPGLVRRRAAEADLFQKPDQATAQSFVLYASSFGAIDYSIPGILPVIAQPTPNTCWAAVFTMMYSWKSNSSISIGDALSTVGPKYLDMFNRDIGLDSNSAQWLYNAAGLEPIYSFNPTIDGWVALLKKYGPLYVDVGYNVANAGTHAIIVTGMSGDGSPDGSSITYVDPIGGTTNTLKFRDFLAKYEAQSAVQWPYTIVHWPAAGQATAQSVAMSTTAARGRGLATMFSSYDRSAAVAYARKFANKACSDGFMMLDDRTTKVTFRGMPVAKVPADANIVRDGDGADHVEKADGSPFRLSDGTKLTSREMDDCTHFISCCIGQPPGDTGGGIEVPTKMWGDPKANNPYGISRVQSLITFLKDNKLVSVVAERTRDKSKISGLDAGDVIAYFNPDKSSFTHLALYLGGGKVAAHTISRLDEAWNLHESDGFKWTLLHFL
jgi:GH24 family phage-related lysozyme (muramidase)